MGLENRFKQHINNKYKFINSTNIYGYSEWSRKYEQNIVSYHPKGVYRIRGKPWHNDDKIYSKSICHKADRSKIL